MHFFKIWLCKFITLVRASAIKLTKSVSSFVMSNLVISEDPHTYIFLEVFKFYNPFGNQYTNECIILILIHLVVVTVKINKMLGLNFSVAFQVLLIH